MALTVNSFFCNPVVPVKIEIAQQPTKVWHKSTLDPMKLQVNLIYSDKNTKDVTNSCLYGLSENDITHAASGVTFNAAGDIVTVYVKWCGKKTLTTSFNVKVGRTIERVSVRDRSDKGIDGYFGEALNKEDIEILVDYSDSTEAIWTYSNATKTWSCNDPVVNKAGATINISPTTFKTVTAEEYNENPMVTDSISCDYTENTDIPLTTFYSKHGLNSDNTNNSLTVFLSPCKIVTWKDGTDAEISKMVEMADEGYIKLSDYWAVGDERTVTLGSMAATGVGESHNSESVTFVLMNVGGKTLSNGKECNFVVGLKNSLSVAGYMNSSNTNSGGWNKSARRTWCNSVFYNAVPSSFRGIFKQFKNKTGLYESQNTLSETTDWFALPAAKEVFPSYDRASNTWFSTTAEWNALSGFSYYNTSANRVKKLGDSGSANWCWLRSPTTIGSSSFCNIFSDGSAIAGYATYIGGLAPFGCI